MKNNLFLAVAMVVFIAMLSYMNKKYGADGFVENKVSVENYGEEEVVFLSNRNYNEPRVQLDPLQLINSYNSNSIRAKAMYDSKLIEITGLPYRIEIAADGDGIIRLYEARFRQTDIYVKGGESFIADAAKISSNYNEISLLCYSDEFSIENPILIDCIFAR